MPEVPAISVSATTIGAPDAPALAAFYERLLGWERVDDRPEWVTLRPPGGGAGLSFMTGRSTCRRPGRPPPVTSSSRCTSTWRSTTFRRRAGLPRHVAPFAQISSRSSGF